MRNIRPKYSNSKQSVSEAQSQELMPDPHHDIATRAVTETKEIYFFFPMTTTKVQDWSRAHCLKYRPHSWSIPILQGAVLSLATQGHKIGGRIIFWVELGYHQVA